MVNLASYTKASRNPRSIAQRINHFSPKAFADFLYDYDQGTLFPNPNRGELVDDLSDAFDLDDSEEDVFMYCGNMFASILEEAKYIEDRRKQRSADASDSRHIEDVEQTPSSEAAATNIYNQTLFYTNGGDINVIGHVDTLKL